MEIETKAIETDLAECLETLFTFGRTKNNGVTRLLYSESWMQAQTQLAGWFAEYGLQVSYDDIGNLYGRLEGEDKDAPALITGSHIDTVVDGGKYDGAYGVVAAMLAVSELKKRYGQPKKPIEVVSLCEEEGSRFPLSFYGSGSMTGVYGEEVRERCDADGASIDEAMKSCGFGQGHYRSPETNDIDAFAELHIEQGSVLEQAAETIGLVTHIVGQRRMTVYVNGESNHAGTTPMHIRHDAMTTAADLIRGATDLAVQHKPDMVATVGQIKAHPNTVNVIAGEVAFTIDIRHYEEKVLNEYIEKLQSFCAEVAAENGVSVELDEWMSAKPVAMDPVLTSSAEKLLEQSGIPYRKMTSGAGHDAQIFGSAVPTALLFVPSVNGISHSPKEFTEITDLTAGVYMLMELIYDRAYAIEPATEGE